MKWPQLILIVISFCWYHSTVLAQQKDFQARMDVELKGDITQDLSWSVYTSQRWKNNLHTADKSILTPSLSYEALDFLSLGLGYRMSWMYDTYDNTRFYQRFQANVALKHKIDRLKLKYRSRLQTGFYKHEASAHTLSENLVHRAKVQMSYRPFGTRIEPYAAAEFFNQLKAYDNPSFEKLRYVLGVEYQFKYFTLNAFYQRDKEYNTTHPMTEHIAGLELGYAF